MGEDITAIAFMAFAMLPGALTGYIVARLARMDSKLSAAVGALLACAATFFFLIAAIRTTA
jgi:Kef-type K+ transport system membrane component KefB